jgi:hypothetical protein
MEVRDPRLWEADQNQDVGGGGVAVLVRLGGSAVRRALSLAIGLIDSQEACRTARNVVAAFPLPAQDAAMCGHVSQDAFRSAYDGRHASTDLVAGMGTAAYQKPETGP